jgi:hypothetical protein
MLRPTPWVRGFLTWAGVSWAARRGRRGTGQKGLGGAGEREAYLYLEEVLRWAVDLLEALLSRIRHSLHLANVPFAQQCAAPLRKQMSPSLVY